ncbi:MAG: serine/threonine protein kinase [Planctomycetes bacterium]|nr:serine/threonine protein kinase [Planctomycetota bacterium]MBU1518570.1 serine/threonine protein kinase [Planctomycetota bacterium]MBU2458463.1 serine/threonine protein kinase [Planctomycetota bacterium]MBU2597465.1 serine/threonine protein kinase [Planctomycetota bacterium]
MSEMNYDSIFGRLVLDQGYCTEEELAYCKQQLKDSPKDELVTLEQLLISNRFITPGQAKRIKRFSKESTKETKNVAEQIPGYKILGKLGAGAMAIVYKAKQLSLDRIVAIKILPRRFSENKDYVQRFYKEGKAAAKLNHNNIVGAYDVGEAGGYHYFVMEYVEGKTLYEDISKGKIFSEKEAIDVVTQVANALAHAHARGLIHRDVKPKNIMINPAGIVKLADLGLARDASDVEMAKSEAGKAFGTPYYISPEQIRGEMDLDARGDIYSLGATFYNMVTGRVPFEASTPSDVMKKHLREPLIPPDHINTSLSAGASEVIEMMMAKRKEDRYSSAEELLTDLDAVRRGEPPLRARRKFNLTDLQELGEGQSIEPQTDTFHDEALISRYKAMVVILGSVIAVLVLLVVFLFASK